MRRALFLLALCLLLPAAAEACPEIVVPLNPQDSAFHSRAWARPLRAYKAQRYRRAVPMLQRQAARLERDVKRLFHPDTAEDAVSNEMIQRWLRRHVYHPKPGVLIEGERFTFPAIVWWAWADTACRAEEYRQAYVALERLNALQPGGEVSLFRALVLLRLERHDEARQIVESAPPDAFLTPYLNGLLALSQGRREVFEEQMGLARLAVTHRERRDAVLNALREAGSSQD